MVWVVVPRASPFFFFAELVGSRMCDGGRVDAWDKSMKIFLKCRSIVWLDTPGRTLFFAEL
jgi:hypothetical protein